MCLFEWMGLFLRVSGVGLWSVLEAFTLVMLTCTCKLIITAKFGSYSANHVYCRRPGPGHMLS